MPYEEEEDRVCEVKCPTGGGVCGIGSTPILLPKNFTRSMTLKASPLGNFKNFTCSMTLKASPLGNRVV